MTSFGKPFHLKLNGILVLSLIALVLSCQNGTRAQNLISPKEFKKVVDAPKPDQVILDIRTMDEVNKGIIPGAVHLDYYDKSFQKKLGQLNKSKTYYVYCHVGGRSAAASKSMEDMGFEFVYDLEGGIVNWQAKGYQLSVNNEQ